MNEVQKWFKTETKEQSFQNRNFLSEPLESGKRHTLSTKGSAHLEVDDEDFLCNLGPVL